MTHILSMAAVLAAVAAAVAGFGGVAGEPSIELIRSTIDGGGAMFSTGGDFELSGTIGQPDAGVLSGGDLELTGGFWFGLAPTDCNDDGAADLLDHARLTECLGGPDQSVTPQCVCFDVDGGGSVDLWDVARAQLEYFAP